MPSPDTAATSAVTTTLDPAPSATPCCGGPAPDPVAACCARRRPQGGRRLGLRVRHARARAGAGVAPPIGLLLTGQAGPP
jgi:hypothetical protein